MPVPYTFATASGTLPLSQLDSNFATAITLGNTALYLGNATTAVDGLSLSNLTVTSCGVANITTLNATTVVATTSNATTTNTTTANITNAVVTANVTNAVGSVTLPSYTFTGRTGDGMWSPASGTLAWSLAGTESYRINSTGLGINVSPSARLHVKSANEISRFETTTARGSGGCFVTFNDPTGQKGLIGYSGGADDIYRLQQVLSADMAFLTGSTEYARIYNATGSFLVGTTSPIAGEKIMSRGSLASYVSRNYNDNATPFGVAIQYPAASPNGTSNQFLLCADSTTTRAEIRSNGGLANFSANNVNLSDERLKTAFAPAKSYYQGWRSVEFVTFLYKDQTDSELNLGVKAQQLETVFPELVDNTGFGEAPEGEAPYKAVYQTDFQYAAARALQEAIEKIELLEARLAALESK